jgi:uroporphyrinogen-III decarboxylase
MIQETMTRRERFEAAVALEPVDRTPVMPLMTAFAVRAQGMTQGEA